MEVIQNVSILRARLEEVITNFFNGSSDQQAPEHWDPRGTHASAVRAFIGDAPVPGFIIPGGADGHWDLVFYHRELLCRWAAMESFSQRDLRRAIHKAFRETNVSEIEMTIPWSKASSRKLRITFTNGLVNPVFHFHLV